VLGGLDAVPGIAGDDPPSGVSSFKGSRYSGSPVRKLTTERSLNRPRVLPSAHEFDQIGAEGDVENRFRICGGDRLHHRTRVDLALRRPLLFDHWISGRFSDISFLNTATADWPYS